MKGMGAEGEKNEEAGSGHDDNIQGNWIVGIFMCKIVRLIEVVLMDLFDDTKPLAIY